MNKKWITVLEILLVVVILGCVGWLLYGSYQKKQQEEIYTAMQEQAALTTEKTVSTETEEVVEETEEATEEEEPKVYFEQVVDFESLKQENEDIYAWLTVQGTDVNYPVLQTEEDDYYLLHNLDHSEGRPGAIYSNASCNGKDFTDYNTILYGHNMKNGTMFGTLHRFDEAEFFEQNSTIYIYTETNRFTYEIVAARKYTDVYLPSYFNFTIDTSRQEYIDMLFSEITDDISHVREGVTVTTEDKLLTLSTCVYQEKTARYLVVGKLVEVAEYMETTEGAESTEGTETTETTESTEGTEN